MEDKMIPLTARLSVFTGAINVGVLREGSRALLIELGDGAVQEALPAVTIDTILFTHHHRDQACAAGMLAALGARLIVPEAERAWFDNVASYWENPALSRWPLLDNHPHHLMLAAPVPVTRTLRDGETMEWGEARITAIATPGHTDGSLSYLVEVDGQSITFCGDLLYDDGQIWELGSLQKGGGIITDYHGFLGARDELLASLHRILAAAPEMLVPSHGRIMRDPPTAVTAVEARLRECYDTYAAISALRWYFPEIFTEYADDPRVMPIRAGMAPPACLRHDGTSWILRSETGAVLVMDCGSQDVINTLQRQLAAEEISAVEGLWITHYHYDHVEAAPAFQQTFDFPTIADATLAAVIAHPLDWRLPCITPNVVRVDRVTRAGESWQWHEFTLTAYPFPGQTLYHDGLLVEGAGLRMFFAGDSFTPAGIDDYCAQNRNFLGAGVGFDQCLALLEELQPEMIFNAHVDVAFDFTKEEIRFMRENLARRESLFGAFFPWEDANFGLDEWVRCLPYEQNGYPGGLFTILVSITNHAAEARQVTCALVPPPCWPPTPANSATIAAKSTANVPLSIDVPLTAVPGRYVLPVDITFGEHHLPQFTEAIVEVKG